MTELRKIFEAQYPDRVKSLDCEYIEWLESKLSPKIALLPKVGDCDTCQHDGECYETVIVCKGYAPGHSQEISTIKCTIKHLESSN